MLLPSPPSIAGLTSLLPGKMRVVAVARARANANANANAAKSNSKSKPTAISSLSRSSFSTIRRSLRTSTSSSAGGAGRSASTRTRTRTDVAAPTRRRSHRIESRLLSDVHPLQLFRIVQDVDRYKDFLPLCSESKVVPESVRNDGRSGSFEAELVVGFGPLGSMLRTRYLSRVSVDPERLRIETISDGSATATATATAPAGDGNKPSERMFESLASCWQLRPVAVPAAAAAPAASTSTTIGTSVDFSVEMTVSDPVIAAVLDQVLYNVAESQVQTFHKRCQTLPPPTSEELELAERFYDTTATK
mmetsp:Transcript_9764/g.21073  ORF Transcript_9764/g.21073 Transcript_9764/m.21073 type:complete len:305 (+) Transcript_9764:51-965(+)